MISACLFGALLEHPGSPVRQALADPTLRRVLMIGSAVPAGVWTSFWIYLTAPLVGMLAAAELRQRLMGAQATHCAKLHHQNPKRCIFCLDASRTVSAA